MKKVIDGCVDLRGLYLTSLPDWLAEVEVTGYFDISGNRLTSLKNCPKHIGGDFYCDDNLLTSLKDGPEFVGFSYNCENNKLTSLGGAPTYIKGSFKCGDNLLTGLEGCPKEVGENFSCYGNPKEFLDKMVNGDLFKVCRVGKQLVY